MGLLEANREEERLIRGCQLLEHFHPGFRNGTVIVMIIRDILTALGDRTIIGFMAFVRLPLPHSLAL
jgi:hypothetical protein